MKSKIDLQLDRNTRVSSPNSSYKYLRDCFDELPVGIGELKKDITILRASIVYSVSSTIELKLSMQQRSRRRAEGAFLLIYNLQSSFL